MAGEVLFVDTFEPEEMLQLLLPCGAVRGNLNTAGLSDYCWTDYRKHSRQWSRKQLGEFLGDIDGVEYQTAEELRRAEESGIATEYTILIEGVGLPTRDGMVMYRLSEDKRFFHPYFTFKNQPNLFARFESWKWAARKSGIEIVETPCLEVSAFAIATAFRKCQEESSTFLKRYLRNYVPPFTPNLHVENLVRLRKEFGVGPVLATRLIDRFGTFWGAVSAPRVELVKVLGPKTADNFIKASGRDD